MIKLTYSAGPDKFFKDMYARASDTSNIVAHAGWRMVKFWMPRKFQLGTLYGWAPSKNRPGGKPLVDTKRLASSFAYNVMGNTMRLGTNVPYSRMLNGGSLGVVPHASSLIISRGKLLTVPNRKVFSQAQMRSVQASDFPNAKKGMVMTSHGKQLVLYEGSSRKKKILFWLNKSVVIVARVHSSWHAEPREFVNDWAAWTMGKIKLRKYPRQFGNPDVGPRRGGRPR